MKKKKEQTEIPEYPTLNEFKSKKFLNIATAVGIGVSAVSLPFSVMGSEKAPAEEKTDKATESKIQKDQIILLAANLGHKDFKERDKATQSLIAIGEQLNKTKNKELTAVLKGELTKCQKSKDPEMKERAKKILLAIATKPVQRDHPRIGGKIRAAGGMRAPK